MYTPAGFPGPREIRLSQSYGPVDPDPAYAVQGGISYSAGGWLPRWRSGPGRLDGQRPGSDDEHGRPPRGGRQRRAPQFWAPEDPPPPYPGRPGAPGRDPGKSGPVVQHRSDRSDPDAVIFWEALDPIQRDAFRSVASPRTFAAGARLIAEGDQADYVIVILSGRTKISVDENGRERILAERGPGQLVGERAALQISVRSANVIALDTVQALVVRTGDFAAFISAHPAVLGIVESQFYDRSREDPVRYQPDEVLAGFRSSYPHLLDGENCTVLLSDVVGFGAHTRTDEDRRAIREALFRITHVVLQELPHVWSWDDRGDGLLTIVPPSVPTARIIQHLHKELPAALEEHNRVHPDSARIQLRVAVNVGPVVTDTMGVSGEAIIIASRLVEAPLFKEEMDRARAALGVIASTFIYESVLRHNPSLSGYSQVRVNVKESSMLAWMKLFGSVARSLY
jgi:CRP-like cAMP-binding protein